MSAPLVDPVFQDKYFGNTADDDGLVIDSLIQEVDSPAKPVTEALDQVPLEKPRHTTRILSGTYTFDFGNPFAAFLLLPADFNRKALTVQGLSFAALPNAVGEYVEIVDENGKVVTSSAGRLRSGQSVDFAEHTGALWVKAGPLTANFELTYWSTTL